MAHTQDDNILGGGKMSDNEKPRENDAAEKDLVFHYSREHRLSSAPAAVRELYNGNSTRTSLGKSLFGSKGNAVIFMSIVIMCAMIGILSQFSSRGTTAKLGANTLNLSLIREKEALGLRILKTVPKSGEFYIGAVDIAVSPAIPVSEEGETPGEFPLVFSHRFFFNPADTETFIIALPFDGDSFYVLLSTDDERKVVRLR